MKKVSRKKDSFDFIGLEFNKKNTVINLGVALGFFIVLLAFSAFGMDISWYGVIIGTGFLMALVFALKIYKFRGLSEDFPYEVLWWIFPFSIIGARAYYCIFAGVPLFWEAFEIWRGGLAIYGGIIGGAIGLILYCTIKKINILKAMDVAAPCLILGQAIGRWGNFVNQEVYGWEITNKALQWFPIGVYIENTQSWHFATFFYESVLNLLGFFLLVYIIRKVKFTGIVTFVYLLFYGIVRYFLEGLRLRDYILTSETGIAVSQVVSLICIVVGTIGICYILLKNSRKEV